LEANQDFNGRPAGTKLLRPGFSVSKNPTRRGSSVAPVPLVASNPEIDQVLDRRKEKNLLDFNGKKMWGVR